jgi:hypothetical protein
MGHLNPESNLFFSYYCKGKGVVSRRLVQISEGRRVTRGVSLRLSQPQWPSKGPARLRNVYAIGADIEEIMEAINKGYLIPYGNLAIAALLQIDDQKKVWLNPRMRTIFEKVEDARKNRLLEENNGGKQGAVHFWQKLERLYELNFLEYGITVPAIEKVESELANFLRGFDIRL